jgi:hypothetical protein
MNWYEKCEMVYKVIIWTDMRNERWFIKWLYELIWEMRDGSWRDYINLYEQWFMKIYELIWEMWDGFWRDVMNWYEKCEMVHEEMIWTIMNWYAKGEMVHEEWYELIW